MFKQSAYRRIPGVLATFFNQNFQSRPLSADMNHYMPSITQSLIYSESPTV